MGWGLGVKNAYASIEPMIRSLLINYMQEKNWTLILNEKGKTISAKTTERCLFWVDIQENTF